MYWIFLGYISYVLYIYIYVCMYIYIYICTCFLGLVVRARVSEYFLVHCKQYRCLEVAMPFQNLKQFIKRMYCSFFKHFLQNARPAESWDTHIYTQNNTYLSLKERRLTFPMRPLCFSLFSDAMLLQKARPSPRQI